MPFLCTREGDIWPLYSPEIGQIALFLPSLTLRFGVGEGEVDFFRGFLDLSVASFPLLCQDVRQRLNIYWGVIPFRLDFSADLETNLQRTFAQLKVSLPLFFPLSIYWKSWVSLTDNLSWIFRLGR